MPKELLAPRKKIAFTPIYDSEFIPIASDLPEVLHQPMVRSQGKGLEGYESGYRSGLLRVGSELYKIKGCRPSGKIHGKQPDGSQTLSLAQYEAGETQKIRESFIKRGFEYPLEPMGIWVYNFFKHNGEPNAATIYRISGDTRIDEFLFSLESIPFDYLEGYPREHIFSLIIRAGIMTGRMLKIMHESGFSWDANPDDDSSNANAGNVLIYRGKKNLAISTPVDFDNTNSFQKSIDPIEYIETVKAIQSRDFKFFINSVAKGYVYSSSTFKPVRNQAASIGLIYRMVKQLAPEMDKVDIETVGAYILKILGPGVEDDLRSRFSSGFIDGYNHTDELRIAEIPWKELVGIKYTGARLRKEFIEKVKTELGGEISGDRMRHIAGTYTPFRGYKLPIVVDIENPGQMEICNQEKNEGPEEERRAKTIALARKLAISHYIYLSGLPKRGENYFFFPTLPQKILEDHSKLNPADIEDMVKFWVDGSLRTELTQKIPGRAIGSFILALAQITPNQLLNAIIKNIPAKDDPELISKLTFLSELAEPLLIGAIKSKEQLTKLRDFRYQLHDNMVASHNIREEIEKKAAVNLFGLGIITPKLSEIFNHMDLGIILNEFTNKQASALEAAQANPKIVDRFIGSGFISSMLKLALTSIQTRNGQQKELSVLVGTEMQESFAGYLLYFFASVDKREIIEDLKKIMEGPLESSLLGFLTGQLLITGKSVHPDSCLAQSLKEITFKADEFATIFKIAVDVSSGDISKIDPIIRSFLEKSRFEGEISDEKASALIMACIGLGVELPGCLGPFLAVHKNKQAFRNFLTKKNVFREDSLYWPIRGYPNNPVYELMSKGTAVLPSTIRNLFPRNKVGLSNADSLAPAIISNLFNPSGYFRNYFGALLNTENYPVPPLGIREFYKSGRSMWEIVHPDIWAILEAADPELIAECLKSEIRNDKVPMEMKDWDSGLIGHRLTPIFECLPPELYKKVYP